MKFDPRSLSLSPAAARLVAATLGVLLLAGAGFRASRAGQARRTQLRAADSTLATFAEWRRRFQPAVAAESIGWRRSWMELRDLGIVGDERVALTQHVAQAAEYAGLRGVRVLITAADTSGSEARLSTRGVRRLPADFGLVVECRGNLQSVISFLGGLPPSVAVTSMRLVRQDGSARHRLTLAVYELDFDNPAAPPIASAPLERGAARAGGFDRVGG